MRRTPGFAILPCAVALLLAAAAPTPAARIIGLGTNAVMESRRGGCHALSLVDLLLRRSPAAGAGPVDRPRRDPSGLGRGRPRARAASAPDPGHHGLGRADHRGPPADWTVRYLEPTDELRRRTEGLYDQRAREQDQGAVRIEGGVFEVFWTEKRTGPGGIEHRHHLRVVESGATLPIDTWLETID